MFAGRPRQAKKADGRQLSLGSQTRLETCRHILFLSYIIYNIYLDTDIITQMHRALRKGTRRVGKGTSRRASVATLPEPLDVVFARDSAHPVTQKVCIYGGICYLG